MLSQSESDSLFIIQLSRIGLIVSTEFDHNNWREGTRDYRILLQNIILDLAGPSLICPALPWSTPTICTSQCSGKYCAELGRDCGRPCKFCIFYFVSGECEGGNSTVL